MTKSKFKQESVQTFYKIQDLPTLQLENASKFVSQKTATKNDWHSAFKVHSPAPSPTHFREFLQRLLLIKVTVSRPGRHALAKRKIRLSAPRSCMQSQRSSDNAPAVPTDSAPAVPTTSRESCGDALKRALVKAWTFLRYPFGASRRSCVAADATKKMMGPVVVCRRRRRLSIPCFSVVGRASDDTADLLAAGSIDVISDLGAEESFPVSRASQTNPHLLREKMPARAVSCFSQRNASRQSASPSVARDDESLVPPRERACLERENTRKIRPGSICDSRCRR